MKYVQQYIDDPSKNAKSKRMQSVIAVRSFAAAELERITERRLEARNLKTKDGERIRKPQNNIPTL